MDIHSETHYEASNDFLFQLYYSFPQAYKPGGKGSCSSPSQEKQLFLGQLLNFSDKSQQSKMEEKIYFYLLNENMEFILSSKTKCPKSGFLSIIIGWSELSQAR